MPFGMSWDEFRQTVSQMNAGDPNARFRLYSQSDEAAASGDPYRQERYGLYEDARNFFNQPGLWDPYGGQMVAGLSPLQQQARSYLQNQLGLGGFGGPVNTQAGDAYTNLVGQSPTSGPGGLLGEAANLTRGAASYRPSTVSAGMVNPAQAAYAGDVNAQNVTGGSFLGGDLGAYMNPYTSNVVDVALGDIERSRQIANQAGARSAGASTYGGSRNALIEAETNRGYADAAARTAAQLRSQGFDTAAGLMSQDLNRGLTAGLANQGANLSAGLSNQGMRQGLNQYNTSALNNLGQFNAGLGLQAQGMNQQAGLAGAGLRMGAANQLAGIGGQQFNQGLAGAGMLNQFGLQDQMTNQLGLDAAYNEWLRSRFGPMQGFNQLSGILAGMPLQQPQGSPWSGLLGLGLTGASFLGGGA